MCQHGQERAGKCLFWPLVGLVGGRAMSDLSLPQERGTEAPGGGPAPLPCQNSNNCTETPTLAPLVGAEKKRCFSLKLNVEGFVKYHGRDHSAFFTTTDKDGLHPKEYAKRWHSFMTHESSWVAGYLRVLEPQRNGRPHFHNVTATTFDMKPDQFDWEAFDLAAKAYDQGDRSTFNTMRARYAASAAPELRDLWKETRGEKGLMARYGLGRCEILPIRKVGAIPHYLGSYLEKSFDVRLPEWKGVRRFELDRRTSQHWKACSLKFSWVSPGAFMWRNRVSQLAFAIGLPQDGDISGLSRKLGRRWAYRMRAAICTSDDREWLALLRVLNVEHQGPFCEQYMSASVEYDNGPNAAW